jgi:hypothetical protein
MTGGLIVCCCRIQNNQDAVSRPLVFGGNARQVAHAVQRGECREWVHRGHCSRDSRSFSHEPERKRADKGKGAGKGKQKANARIEADHPMKLEHE